MVTVLKLVSGETLIGLVEETVTGYDIKKPMLLDNLVDPMTGRVGITFNNVIFGANELIDKISIKKDHVMFMMSELQLNPQVVEIYKKKFVIIL